MATMGTAADAVSCGERNLMSAVKLRSLVRPGAALAIAMLVTVAARGDAPAGNEEAARRLVARLAAGEFEAAAGPFDEAMQRALPAGKLEEVWGGLVQQYGALRKVGAARSENVRQYAVVLLACEFERAQLDAKVVFDAKGQVSGLFFVPAGKYQRPAYVDPAKFEEHDVTVGSGLMRLPGTLAVPKGAGPFAAVVLVHGSGPNDRDETIGPNKPFRDLAQGLACRGIAVLRYEKRTREHPVLVTLAAGSLTVKEETIDDAVSAVELLQSREGIDAQRVFVLGHSMGGMLIPRIAKAKPGIAGFISLAGSARPIEDHALEQTKYLLGLDGELSDEDREKIGKLEAEVARIKSPELGVAAGGASLLLGAPACYWLDLRAYDPAAEIKAVRVPILVLQGERDYQVTMTDFGRWKDALAGRQDARLVSYPRLNHLFVAGQGRSTPAEYSAPGNVAPEVIEDVARWIHGLNRP